MHNFREHAIFFLCRSFNWGSHYDMVCWFIFIEKKM